MPTAITLELGRFIAGLRHRDLPREVVPIVHAAFADTIGVTMAGSGEAAPRLIREMLMPSGGEATILGRHGNASALDAAWINGTAAHALDYDDVSQRGFGHGSTVLVPAILAGAEASQASGAQVVTAYIAGYEVMAELVVRDRDIGEYHVKGWHPTGVFGAVGAAAACASLLRLDAEQAACAMAIAATQSAGLIANVGTMSKPLHAGRGAHAGLSSALLAKAGFTGAQDVFEHQPGFLTAFSNRNRLDLDSPVRAGVEWRIAGANRISVKKYPLCYCTHRCIDGSHDLMAAHTVDWRDIERIVVSISPRNAHILRNHRPRNGLEAKFSIEFAVVAPIIAGRAGLAELTDAFVLREDVQSLIERVAITWNEDEDPARPGYAAHDQVVLEMKDGRRLDSGPVRNARGDHDLPLGQAELRTKFDDCLRAFDPDARPDAAFDALMRLEELPDMRGLVSLLHAAGPGRT